jgi:hypothetical protein
MSIVKAYHAGALEDIELFICSGRGLAYSSAQGNWLGEGVYFWENDPGRAEDWQVSKGKGAILECKIDTRCLFNLLRQEKGTETFYRHARDMLPDLGTRATNIGLTQESDETTIIMKYNKPV